MKNISNREITLEKLIFAYNFIELDSFFYISLGVLDSLRKLHKNNTIYKYLNPNNILVTNDLKGVRLLESEFIDKSIQKNLLYMSPEQIGKIGKNVDFRTDFYSLGATLYIMLTGKLPFSENSEIKLAYSHIAKKPLGLSALNNSIPNAISNIVMKLLSKDPDDRYKSIYGIRKDLKRCQYEFETNGNIENFILGQEDTSDKFKVSEVVYGRNEEIERVMSKYISMINGNREVIFISGSSGIGKSTLMKEIGKRVIKEGGIFISGKCEQYNDNTPYSLIIQSIKELILKMLTESEDNVIKLKKKILSAIGIYGQVIIDVIPEIEYIIGTQPALEKLPPSESENRFNLVMGKVVKALLRTEKPMVIFWDDLQWADVASLKMLDLIAFDNKQQNVLIVGAYIKDKLSANFILKSILKSEVKKGITINNIQLKPLEEKYISNLICNTLSCDKKQSETLTKLVSLKTGGNPFFIKMILESIYSEGMLTFNYKANKWEWDIELINNLDIYNNVLELLIKKIEKLPAKTRELLKVAACIGIEFSLDVLWQSSNSNCGESFINIIPAVEDGILIHSKQYTDSGCDNIYRFSHNQIFQHFYSSISKDKQNKLHYEIGKVMLYKTYLNRIEEKVFDIVKQFNISYDLIESEKELYTLINLNLIAGKKAKSSTAYNLALRYLRFGHALLKETSWDTHYDLAYDIYIELAECEYINSNISTAEEIFSVILTKSKTKEEKARVYNMRIMMYTHFHDYEKAIDIGLEGLLLFSIILGKKISKLVIYNEIIKMKWILKGKSIYQVFNKRTIHNKTIDNKFENKLEIKKLLCNMALAAFFYDTNLYYALTLKEINLVLKYGNEDSGSYINYAILLCLLFKDYKQSYEIGLLDVTRCESIKDKTVLSRSLSSFSNMIVLWSKNFDVVLEYLERAYRVCAEVGDMEYASYSANSVISVLFMKGEKLEVISDKLEEYREFVEKLGNNHVANNIAIKNLIINEIIENDSEDITESNSFQYILNDDVKSIPLGIYPFKIMLCYLFNKNIEGEKLLESGKLEAISLKNSITPPLFYFSSYLIMVNLIEENIELNKAKYIKDLIDYKNKMKVWATSCPENYMSYYMLMEAELCRINNELEKAELFYDKVIKHSIQNELVHLTAITSERVGKFYKSKGKQVLYQTYLSQSYYFYKKWGAFRKLRNLEKEHSHLLTDEYIEIRKKDEYRLLCNMSEVRNMITATELDNSFDIMTVVRASQAISGEMLLENLLRKLMKNLIENTGAYWGCLILKKEEEYLVQMEGRIDKLNSMVLKTIKVDDYKHIPKSIINYVKRTRQGIVLKDARSESIFNNDSYIIDEGIKSVLCAPIINNGNILGMIYLENNLSTNVFEEEKLTIVNLLSSQAAISIQNAYMYKEINELNEQLEMKVEERTKSLIETIRYEELRTEFFANISHELRTPLNVIFGGYQMIELMLKDNMPSKNGDKIENYLSTVKQNCYRLVRLINNLIDITKMDSGYFQLDLENLDIVNVVESITLSVAEYIKNNGVSLIFDTYVEEKVMSFDADKIERIMLNLLSNALKFTSQGGNIIVTMYNRRDTIIISVKDDGIGIPEDKQKSIFDRFIQVDKSLSRNREGSGIGLSIVKSLVELHGGTISLKSELGKGSEFFIEIPVKLENIENQVRKVKTQSCGNKIEKIQVEFSDIYS
jgi:predicted ATPase/signal transduction histidine kinase